MSSLYNLEPQPTAKVILHTTLGDLLLELFAKQTPLASRNFLQHCLNGYYDNTIFHRLVPGFIVQGGDPTGTGSGGLSAINDGKPFDDEFHSRLKFNRRGLLGSANEGKNSNGSQFFLTLGTTPELQGKNTMFGRIEGDTIYNLMKLGDAELAEGEGSERPLYPTKITGTEVLVNPFDDLVPTIRAAAPVPGNETKSVVKKRRKNAGKGALSFEDGDEQDTTLAIVKKAKFNTAVASADQEIVKEAKRPKTTKETKEKGVFEGRRAVTAPKPPLAGEMKSPRQPSGSPSDSEAELDDQDMVEKARTHALDKTNAEIAALKASMKRGTEAEPQERSKPKSVIEAMIPDSSTRGRKRGRATDEAGALDIFKAFKARLDDIPTAEEPADSTKSGATEKVADATPSQEDEDEAEVCDLHFIANCQSCKAWDDETGGDVDMDNDDLDGAWMTHRLTFAKDTLGKDLEWKKKMQEIEIIDPREKARSIRDERKRDKIVRPTR